MDPAAEMLFSYLRAVIYDPANADLDVEKLPEDFQVLGSGLQFFAEKVMEVKKLAQAMSKGDLTGNLPSRDNEIASPLKSLHASLKHLTWQAQQIAQGDYQQRVGFMGEFSDAFNTMIEQLAERQQKLEDKINQIQSKTNSLEQSNLLLNALMHHAPLQIFVINRDTLEVLLMNRIAAREAANDPKYVDYLIKAVSSDASDTDRSYEFDIKYDQGEHERYFTVMTYFLEWDNSSAKVLAVSDVSDAKSQMKELEAHAYQDNITQLYNRTFGMITLNSWLEQKKQFVLVFADLDGLKYINDEFGHNEGDIYIMNAAKHLKSFSAEAVICRIGGDEFMVLAQNTDYDEAAKIMDRIFNDLQNDEFLRDKTYSYSMSYGINAVYGDNLLSAGDILSIADERMYENKRMRKKSRQK